MDINLGSLIANGIAALAAAASAVFSASSARAAFKAIKQNEIQHAENQAKIEAQRENTRLLDHAIVTLERAFTALMGNDVQLPAPPRNRLNWLTSARLIEEYKATKDRISDPLLLRECNSHEDHWRLQISRKLESLTMGQPEYFKHTKGNDRSHMPIHLVSAVVVCSFSQWPEDQLDPIDKYASPADASARLHLSQAFAQLRFHAGIE